MSEITNKFMPEISAAWMKKPPRPFVGRADYSATTLIQSPQQVQLHKRHRNDVTSDLREGWNAFLGNVVHQHLETKLAQEGYATEVKVEHITKGRRVVAIVDAYKDGVVYDHKTCKGPQYTLKKEWEQQLNINAYMLRLIGVPVDTVAIHVVMLDWKPSQAYTNSNYPQSPCYLLTAPCWEFEEQERFFNERLNAHIANEELKDSDLDKCTNEDRWIESCYAVIRATGSCAKKEQTKEAAEQYIKDKKLKGAHVEYREGTPTKCILFCDYKNVCPQYQGELNAKARKQEKEATKAVDTKAVQVDA